MLNNFIKSCCFVLLLAAAASCKKSGGSSAADVPEGEVVITEKGVNNGPAATKIIDAGGGQLVSADGKLKVTVPAGAVHSAVEFSIQPITNTFDPRNGRQAYRLLPEDVNFTKPVQLHFTYDNTGMTPEEENLLVVSHQTPTGSWKMVPTGLDKANKTLTVETSHFSDWLFCEFLDLYVEDQELTPGEETDIIISCYDDEGINRRFGIPNVADRMEITAANWRLARGAGTLTPFAANVPHLAKYTAPAKVSGTLVVEVSVTLNGLINIDDPKAPGQKRSFGQMILLGKLFVTGAQIAVTLGGNLHLFTGEETECLAGRGITMVHGENEEMTVTIQVNAEGVADYPCGAINQFGKADITIYKLKGTQVSYGTTFIRCFDQGYIHSAQPVSLTKYGEKQGEYIEGKFEGSMYIQGNPCPSAQTISAKVEFTVPRS
ncbi:MAG TPA: hypothetical protein VD996_05890 [Chitinophagaceae bacterium]|nr:hypothetical protein [Chitinophagaceae bacterium]